MNNHSDGPSIRPFVKANPALKRNGKLEPVLFAKSPKTIKYATKPPRLGGEPKEIPISELEKQENFTWTDTVLVPPDMRDVFWNSTKVCRTYNYPTLVRLNSPLETLAVCFIDETVGKGAFLPQDAAPLEEGTPIAIDASACTPAQDEQISPYSIVFEFPEKHPLLGGMCMRFDAEKHGNIVRFMQDLPTTEEVENLKNLTPLQRSNIATQNVNLTPAIINGCPVMIAYACRRIMPGEQLGYPYGPNYEYSGKRCVFNLNGEVIGTFIGKDSVAIKDSYQPSLEMTCPRIRSRHIELIPTSDLDPASYMIDNACFALQVLGGRLPAKSYLAGIFNVLSNLFLQQPINVVKAYKAFQSFCKVIKPEKVTHSDVEILQQLIVEMDYQMNCYYLYRDRMQLKKDKTVAVELANSASNNSSSIAAVSSSSSAALFSSSATFASPIAPVESSSAAAAVQSQSGSSFSQ